MNSNIYTDGDDAGSVGCKEDIIMGESRFIRTVAFGGYDKLEVVRRLEYLNSQVYDLRNELRETKLLLESYKKGTDIEKAHEAVLAAERTKLTQLQVQNDTLNTKLKASDDENRGHTDEIKEMKGVIADLNEQLKNANAKVAALEAQNEAMALSNVFIEAQKSASMLESAAKAKADEIEERSRKTAEGTVSDANAEAAQIIYEAERTAAETIAEARNKAEEMETASNNLKSVALNEVYIMREQVSSLLGVLEGFRDDGIGRLNSASQLLDKTENTLKEGGVPVFRQPDSYVPELPDPPISLYDKMRNDSQSEEEKQRKKNELDKLKQMAASIGKKESDKQEDIPEPAKDEPVTEQTEKKTGKINLAELAAKAKALEKN